MGLTKAREKTSLSSGRSRPGINEYAEQQAEGGREGKQGGGGGREGGGGRGRGFGGRGDKLKNNLPSTLYAGAQTSTVSQGYPTPKILCCQGQSLGNKRGI